MTLAALIAESREDREGWLYTDLKAFAALTPARPAVGAVQLPPMLSRHRLVFVGGCYDPALSVLPDLPDGFVTQPQGGGGGACRLSVSAQMCLAVDPVELLFIDAPQTTEAEAAARIEINLSKNGRLTLLERHVLTQGKTQTRHIDFDIMLAQQAKLIHGKMVCGNGGDLHFARTHVCVDGGAFYDHFALVTGGRLVRCAHDIELRGKLAEARLLAALLLNGDRHADMTALVRHNAPHTTSRQLCKAVLADKACGVFKGKVKVEKGAQKTDGYQLCRALLLSDKAEMDAKPELEIYADDVKCSHGAAIGDLDENALFYLLSRGIDEKTARAMLVEAFVGELVDQIPAQDLALLARQEVETWLVT